ncbi:hypothetical protein QTP88_005874 [Uroleucon formosanum]
MLKQGSRGGQRPLPPPHNNRFSFYHIVRRRVPLSPAGNNKKDFCRTAINEQSGGLDARSLHGLRRILSSLPIPLSFRNNANFCICRVALYNFIVASNKLLTAREFVQESAGSLNCEKRVRVESTTKDCQKTVS